MPLLQAIARRGAVLTTALTTPFLPEDYLALVNPLWGNELRARVQSVVPEADGAATLVLAAGGRLRPHRPGQYIGVGVEIDGVRHWRSYSLTSERLTITVKAQGLVSRHLVRRTPVGTVLALREPAGEFTWRGGKPALFLTAGSGVTPVAGMLRQLAAQGALPDVHHVHSSPTADRVIFGPELRSLAAGNERYQLSEQHTTDHGRFALPQLEDLVPDWRTRQTWACGPASLLDTVEAHWAAAGLADQLTVERFTPPSIGSGQSGVVHFARTGATTHTASTLLEAGESAGALMPSGCRMGICHSCVVPLVSGQVRDVRTGEVHGEPGDLVQTCISTPAGDCSLDV